jgi:hypothetical protein
MGGRIPIGYRNNAVGLLLNHCLDLRSAAPGRCRGLGFRHVQRTTLVERQRSALSWTNGPSKTTCAMALSHMQTLLLDPRNVFPSRITLAHGVAIQPTNQQHCRTRRRSSLYHAPRHVRTHSPLSPFLSPLIKLTLTPHQHILPPTPNRYIIRRACPRHVRVAQRLAQDYAFGRFEHDRGAHRMLETRRRI